MAGDREHGDTVRIGPDLESEIAYGAFRSTVAAQDGPRRTAQAVERGICSRSRARRSQRLHIAEHRSIEPRLFLRKSEIGRAHAAECFENCRTAIIPGSREPLAKQLKAATGELSHELVAIAEMAVRRGRGHADAFRRLRQGETRGAAFRD